MTEAAERARGRHQRLRRVEHRAPDLRGHPDEREIELFLGARLADVEGSEPPP